MAEFIRAYEGNKPYIFVSYSHKNSSVVLSYIEKLYELKYRVWYDEGIAPGNGVTCYTKDSLYTQQAIKVKVVDSTGAGDSFAGSFLHFYSNNEPIDSCLKYASASGAYACSKVGGMAGAIEYAELIRFLKEKSV